MKTNWKSGDIITANKINNIIQNSQINKNFICLNDYYEYEDFVINYPYKDILSVVKNNGVVYFYYNNNLYCNLINWEISWEFNLQKNALKLYYISSESDTGGTRSAPIIVNGDYLAFCSNSQNQNQTLIYDPNNSGGGGGGELA